MKYYGLLIIEIIHKQECIFIGRKAIDCLSNVMPEIVNENWKYLEPYANESNLSDRFYELTNVKMDTYGIVSHRNEIIEEFTLI